MIIGYQGQPYSFNHKAAKEFAVKLGLESYKLEPLLNSQNVVNALKSKKIDYGVVAIQNSIAGIVKESYEALKTESFELVHTAIIQIDHCIFVKEGIQKYDIRTIASHEMALKQCQNYIQANFLDSRQEAVGDTAHAAYLLAHNKLDENTAVICSKEAGIANGLTIVDEGIQDTTNNFTEFRLFKIRNIDDKIHFKNKLLSYFYNDEKQEIVFKTVVVALIFILFLLYDYVYRRMSPFGAAWTFGGAITSFLLIISNKKLRNQFYYSFIKGYWTYQVVTDNPTLDPKQNYSIPRIVEILEENGDLKFSILELMRIKCLVVNVVIFALKRHVSQLQRIEKRASVAFEHWSERVSVQDFGGSFCRGIRTGLWGAIA